MDIWYLKNIQFKAPIAIEYIKVQCLPIGMTGFCQLIRAMFIYGFVSNFVSVFSMFAISPCHVSLWYNEFITRLEYTFFYYL